MKLIPNFEIGSFARIVWLNKAAREMWEKPIQDIGSFVQELEILSLVEGHRLCSWQTINCEKVLEMTQKWANLGLSSLPVKEVAQFQGFAHKHEPPAPGGPKAVCFVISRDVRNCVKYRDAFLAGDNAEQGALLGFPKCCGQFFSEVWKEGFFDPMWQVAQNSLKVEESEFRVRVKAHAFSNPLLRYIGVRVGFHIPHSFNCFATVNLASTRLELARKRDPQLTALLEALLNMPMKWDVLHGVAIVKTPIFYLVVQSVPAIDRHIVDVDGSFIPKEAENGAICDS